MTLAYVTDPCSLAYRARRSSNTEPPTSKSGLHVCNKLKTTRQQESWGKICRLREAMIQFSTGYETLRQWLSNKIAPSNISSYLPQSRIMRLTGPIAQSTSSRLPPIILPLRRWGDNDIWLLQTRPGCTRAQVGATPPSFPSAPGRLQTCHGANADCDV